MSQDKIYESRDCVMMDGKLKADTSRAADADEEMLYMDDMLRMDEKIREFRDRVMRGDKKALAQIEDVMHI